MHGGGGSLIFFFFFFQFTFNDLESLVWRRVLSFRGMCIVPSSKLTSNIFFKDVRVRLI